MPEFKDPAKLLEVKGTTNYPDLELKMADALTGQDAIDMDGVEGTARMIAMLAALIKEWNFEESGKVMEISLDVLKRFDLQDLTEIFEKYNKQAVKKTTPNK